MGRMGHGSIILTVSWFWRLNHNIYQDEDIYVVFLFLFSLELVGSNNTVGCDN